VKESLSSKYRDRAEERRLNVNPDYQDNPSEEILTAFHAVAPVDQHNDESSKSGADSRASMIEKSKYLGGDIDHTHLVKGLDYALLNKVKDQMKKIVKVKQEEPNAETTSPSPQEGSDEELSDPDIFQPSPVTQDATPSKISFQTTMAKAVYNQLFNKVIPSTTELFLPGRTAFIFELDSDKDIPTTIVRAKDDVLRMKELVTDKLSDSLIEQMDKIMNYLREGKSKKKKEKRQ